MKLMNLDEYCDHCAKKKGLQHSSFKHLCKVGASAHVMCKGCGLTTVDHLGRCLKCERPQNYVFKFCVIALIILGAIIQFFNF